jgi:hypothetical protein
MPMSLQVILLPLFVQAMLTLGLGMFLAYRRGLDFSSGAVRPSQIALREPNWPRPTMQVSNSYSNQFELPVLFYVVTVLALITSKTDLIFLVLSWIFVIARLVQAFIHITHNNVKQRGAAFGVGAVALLVMWIIFIARILAAA